MKANNGQPCPVWVLNWRPLAFLHFRSTRGNWKTQAHTGRLLWIALRFRATCCISDRLGAHGRKHIHFYGYRRLNATVEQAWLRATDVFLTRAIFFRACRHIQVALAVLRKNADKMQTKRRQNAVNAGTVPASRNAWKWGRPVTGFMLRVKYLHNEMRPRQLLLFCYSWSTPIPFYQRRLAWVSRREWPPLPVTCPATDESTGWGDASRRSVALPSGVWLVSSARRHHPSQSAVTMNVGTESMVVVQRHSKLYKKRPTMRHSTVYNEQHPKYLRQGTPPRAFFVKSLHFYNLLSIF